MVTAFVVLVLAAVTLFIHILTYRRARHPRERLHRKLKFNREGLPGQGDMCGMDRRAHCTQL